MTNDMQPIRRILAAVKDPTAGISPALAKAALIAQATGADLTLFHAIDLPICADAYATGSRTLEDDRVSLRRDFLESLEQLAHPLRERGLQVRTAAEWDFPAYEAILRVASRSGIDLIVTEHRHSREAALWPARPTDWELLRVSPVPLLIVKQRLPYSPAPVLAAIDPLHRHAKPADLDDHILRLAQLMGTTLGGAWQVLHAFPPGRHTGPTGEAEGAEARSDADQPRAAVDSLLRSLEVTPASVHVLPGRPADTILQLARRLNSPLVVMGAVSRSGLPRLVIGNTAEKLIDELPCDILVVKSETFGVRFSQQVHGMRVYSVLNGSPG